MSDIGRGFHVKEYHPVVVVDQDLSTITPELWKQLRRQQERKFRWHVVRRHHRWAPKL
jgi:hypothetical protein